MIELLIVITIIIVLAAISLAIMNRVKKSAQEAVCFSNIHQMGIAIGSYAGDHNGEMPVNNHPTDGYRWYLMLNPYLGKPPDSSDGGWAAPSIFICPGNDPHQCDNQYKIWIDLGYRCNLKFMPRWSGGSSSTLYPGSVGRLSTMPTRQVLVGDTGHTNRNQFFGMQGQPG